MLQHLRFGVRRNRLVAQYRIGSVPAAATGSLNPTDPGFRAFGGGGRRLGEQAG